MYWNSATPNYNGTHYTSVLYKENYTGGSGGPSQRVDTLIEVIQERFTLCLTGAEAMVAMHMMLGPQMAMDMVVPYMCKCKFQWWRNNE